ncbi:MAG TPA: MurT ligase domain-containing protein [Candidatus Eisenbacteria bacterium]|nr:MurT ligase domain-containing protein [Candidatus Eisenbacteria bacterium]
MKQILSLGAKVVSKVSKKLNLGHGSTWPGHIALHLNPHIIDEILQVSPTEVVLIVGTNGKTTTGKILTTILRENGLPAGEAGKKVVQNISGANLLNGIASTLLLNTNPYGRLTSDYAIFEVDENNLPLVLQHITPKAIIALNLFRDQLDRYGELDSIAKKWNASFRSLAAHTTLVLNADDPLISYVAKEVSARVVYFGLPESEKGQKELEHAADSVYCPNCGNKLQYTKIFYSHLGIWECPMCHIKRPFPSLQSSIYPLPGMYNKYNTLAAVLASIELGISPKSIDAALEKVTPAFGRQEKLVVHGKNVQIFLAKNPISMNESLKTIADMKAKHVLFALNDRIPDGLDVSWIWDISLEDYIDRFKSIYISGDRVYDMGLRFAYSRNDKFLISNFKSNPNIQMFENLKEAIKKALEELPKNETLYILPTYSAMLEVRKILTGKKIL